MSQRTGSLLVTIDALFSYLLGMYLWIWGFFTASLISQYYPTFQVKMTSPSSQVKLHLRLRAKRMVSSASKLVKKALKRSENLLTRFLSAALDDGPKKTPPPATPLEFPAFRPIGKAVAGTNLFHLYASIRKSSDITPYHVDALNLEVEHDVLLDQLIPKEFLPPQEWESDPSINPDSSAPPSSKTLSNGAAIPSHEVYHIRKKELLYSNDDGFRVLSMRPGYGRQGIKLVHFRKFWERLNAVAQYWDTSLDGDDPAVMQPFPASPDKQAMDIDEIRSEVRSTDEAAPNTSASSTKPERKDSKDTQSEYDYFDFLFTFTQTHLHYPRKSVCVILEMIRSIRLVF